MSSALEQTKRWLIGPETPVLLVAIVVALPTAYGIQHWLGGGFEAGFLMLMTLGVGVPQLYDRWPPQYGPAQAVAWVLVACTVMTAVFVAVFVIVTELGASTTIAAIVAFLIADLGPLAFASRWRGPTASE